MNTNPNFDKNESKLELVDTAPRNVSKASKNKQTPRILSRWKILLLGLVAIFITTLIGGLIGYRIAIQKRISQQNEQLALDATSQYQLGIKDLEEGRYDAARKRFEYIIQVDPSFPGAAEKLTEIMVAMAQISTPTPFLTPTIAITATKDTRAAEEIYNHANDQLRAKDWNGAIESLDAIRRVDINYRTLDVDGMYYIALRHLGVEKIVSGSNLEGGIYDLALTERFGPLDKDANSFRQSARAYLSGASFWGIDWVKVVEYLGAIYNSLPNMRDGSGMTVAERYRTALIKVAEQLIEKEDYCGARDYYALALAISDDPRLAPEATRVQLICSPPTMTPQPTTEITIIPTEETPIPVETTVAPPPVATTEAPQPTAATE